MFAGSNTCPAFSASALINFNNIFSCNRLIRADFNAAYTSPAAAATCAFAVFPAAFFIIYNNWHKNYFILILI